MGSCPMVNPWLSEWACHPLVCDGVNCVPSNTCVEVLTPSVTVFRDRVSKELQLNEVVGVGP